MPMTPKQRAEKCAEIMLSADQASASLGISLVSAGPGTALVEMQVEACHLNGHKICHGGFIFTLADTAFAVACNAYNQLAVSLMSNITHLRQTSAGETLTAKAVEVQRFGRTGIYDVSVANQDGIVVAEFRGHSRTIKGQHFEEEAQGE